MVHFGHKGDPYGQNFDPREWGAITLGIPYGPFSTKGCTLMDKISTLGVGSNKAGDPLGASLDLRGGPLWTKFRPGLVGWGATPLGTPQRTF